MTELDDAVAAAAAARAEMETKCAAYDALFVSETGDPSDEERAAAEEAKATANGERRAAIAAMNEADAEVTRLSINLQSKPVPDPE